MITVTESRERWWRVMSNVNLLEPFRTAFHDLLTKWGKESLVAFLTACGQLWAGIVSHSTITAEVSTVIAVLMVLLDTMAGYVIAYATGEWTRKKSLNWMAKLALYTFVGVAFFLIGVLLGVMIYGEHMDFTIAYACATFVSVNVAALEFCEFLNKVNRARRGRLQVLIAAGLKLGKLLSGAAQAVLPINTGKENPNGNGGEDVPAAGGGPAEGD